VSHQITRGERDIQQRGVIGDGEGGGSGDEKQQAKERQKFRSLYN
jgi:hypothetical protein